MALIEKHVKAIESDPELAKRLKELWAQGAPVSEFYEVLTAAGLDVDMENLQDTHAELQKQRGEMIASGKVDLDQLRQIAGGGSGVDCSAENDCDLMFKNNPSRTDRCYVLFACDQALGDI